METRIEIRGNPYVIRFDLESFIAVEDFFGVPLSEFAADPNKHLASMTGICKFLCAGMRHADPTLTPTGVARLIGDASKLQDLLEQVTKALEAALSGGEEKKTDSSVTDPAREQYMEVPTGKHR